MLWWDLRRLKSKDAFVRARIAQRLTSYHHPRVVESLATLLNDEDAGVRRVAAEALGTIGDRRAVARLVEALVDRAEMVRKEAADALERIDPKWPESAGAQEGLEMLLPAIARRDTAVQRDAMWALQRIDPQWPAKANGMTGHLLEALGDANPFVADNAVAALDRIDANWRSSDSVAVIRTRFQEKLLHGEIPEFRWGAVLGLARLRDDSSITSLIHALGDGSELVRKAAADSLGQIGGARVIDALSAALERKDTNDVRHALRDALKEARLAARSARVDPPELA